ncbi:MAG: hypothetical protein L3J91_00720, partial [Thermoplasmata archaeon]|nr:hypothetical protein [Thermoplasmata archaeon]
MKQRIWIALASVALLVIAGSASYVLLSRNSPSTAPPGGAVPTCAPTGTSHPPASNQTEGNWTTYHGDATRTGYLPSVPITSAQPRWTNPAVLDADVYAEPLVCGTVAYVATENN